MLSAIKAHWRQMTVVQRWLSPLALFPVFVFITERPNDPFFGVCLQIVWLYMLFGLTLNTPRS